MMQMKKSAAQRGINGTMTVGAMGLTASLKMIWNVDGTSQGARVVQRFYALDMNWWKISDSLSTYVTPIIPRLPHPLRLWDTLWRLVTTLCSSLQFLAIVQ